MEKKSGMEIIHDEILRLKEERNAVILAHNYQLGEVQDVADFIGDSLELSRKAAAIDSDVIVFCGVHFMAETAAILSPDKTVLIPSNNAGCRMADMITASELADFRSRHPGSPVVCYVNSSAEVKALSDICCTSANAVKVVESLEADEILFVPDKYLCNHVSRQTEKKVICWDGFCPTHARILASDVERKRREYPDARVVVHPECPPDVIDKADEALSTGGILRYASSTTADTIIVGTEMGIVHRLEKENPDKRFVLLSEQAVCPDMKSIQIEDVRDSLLKMQFRVIVEENLRLKALEAVERMIAIG